MKENENNMFNTYEIKRATSEIKEIKDDMKEIKSDDKNRDERINRIEKKQALMEHKLDTIINNTARTNHMIQQVIFGAIATGVIGGAIAIIWAYLGGS